MFGNRTSSVSTFASYETCDPYVNISISLFDPSAGVFPVLPVGSDSSCTIFKPKYFTTIDTGKDEGIQLDTSWGFTAQTALQYGKSEMVLQLATTGCGNDYNCTLTCLNRISIFENPATLANCLAYPKIARVHEAGNLTVDAEKLVDQYSIQKDRNVSASIEGIISGCWENYCSADTKCSEENQTDTDSRNGAPLSGDWGDQMYTVGLYICQSVSAPILGDVSFLSQEYLLLFGAA